MRLCVALLCCLTCVGVAGAQAKNSDPYAMEIVGSALRYRPLFVLGSLQRHIFQLGDDASIALLKILDDRQLTDPVTLSHYLPIIHDAFSHPENITNEVDKTPRVTLFLLNYLRQNVKDTSAQTQIQATIGYVKKQAAQPAPGNTPHP